MLYRNFGKGEIRRGVLQRQALMPPLYTDTTDVTNATRPNWNGGMIMIIKTTSNLKKVSDEAEVNQNYSRKKLRDIKTTRQFANAELSKNFMLRLLRI